MIQIKMRKRLSQQDNEVDREKPVEQMMTYRVDSLSNEHQSLARPYESNLFEQIAVQNEPLIYQVPIN